MMSNQKSISVLEAELKQLNELYKREGIDLVSISKAHKEWEKARKFLTRNKNNQEHYCMAEYKEMFDCNKNLAAKYNKRIRIINKIKSGAQDTADIRFRPWGVAAYICGLSHMNMSERISLERQWKVLVEDLLRRGHNCVFSWINAGSQIVESYNSYDDVNVNIRFVHCISSEDNS